MPESTFEFVFLIGFVAGSVIRAVGDPGGVHRATQARQGRQDGPG